eukprot:5742603-Amphidinium_carterae.1
MAQEDGSFLPVRAKGLRINDDSCGEWEDCLVHDHDLEEGLFTVSWASGLEGTASALDVEPESGTLTRMQLIFYGEDPELFADRIQFAFQSLHR